MMKKYIIMTGAAAICIALGVAAIYLYRAYKVADIISDEARYDMMDVGYRSLTVDEYEKAIADTKCSDLMYGLMKNAMQTNSFPALS